MIEQELIDLIGLDEFISLVERFGGTRIYIPQQAETSRLDRLLSRKTLEALISAYARNYIAVPLARMKRAQHYRRRGYSHVFIARRLGISENGVSRLFHKLGESGVVTAPIAIPVGRKARLASELENSALTLAERLRIADSDIEAADQEIQTFIDWWADIRHHAYLSERETDPSLQPTSEP